MSLRATAAAFVKEGGIGLAVMVLLVLLVWLGGDYLSLAPVISQAIIVGIVCVGVALFVTRRMLARRQAKKLATKFLELAAEDADATLGERKAKQQEIAALLREGVAHLRVSAHGEKAVSELPWYLVVGSASAGKSTLLESSGLAFAQMGRTRKPVIEAGTTRDLDWWLTDSAVFLDVPGRYISSNESPFEWPAFVGALKEARAHAPVSGVIIVVSVPEILELKNEEVEPYAKNIRDRLDELSAQCRWVFPVYVVFSKCDAICGFAEAFGNLAEEERCQTWGATLPFKIDENRNYRTIFHDECNRLSEPLREQILAALAQDAAPAIKEQTALFPRQVFLAQRRMGEVLGAVFRPNPFIETGLLRGFYFASATQGGAAHDLVREAKLEQRLLERAPYFVSQLFTRVLPPDRNLARLAVKEAKRRRALAMAVGVASVAVTIALSTLMLLAYSDQRQAMTGVQAAREHTDEFARMEALRQSLTAADAPRSLARAVPFAGAETRLTEAARAEYYALARQRVLQPVVAGIERNMRETRERGYVSIQDYDAALAASVALHMLAGHTPASADALRPVLSQAARQISTGDGARQALLFAQVDYLLADVNRLKQAVPLMDTALLALVDEDLKGALWVQAAYLDLVRDAPSLPPATRDTLVLGPGRDYISLGKNVPGMFTQRGYDEYVGPAIARRAQELATRFAAMGQSRPMWSLAAEITDRYADDHAAAWAAAQASFSIADVDGLEQSIIALKSLCGRESALRELLTALRDARSLKLLNGTIRNAVADDLKWLDAALAPLAKIPTELEAMLQATSDQNPMLEYQRQGKLELLAGKFNQTARAMDDAMAFVPAELRARYQAVLDRLLEGVVNELRQQSQLEAQRLWQDSMVGFSADVAGYFPFNAQSLGEAPVNTVARLLNPKNGSIQGAINQLKLLRGLEITVGHIPDVRRMRLLDFSPEFEAALLRLGALQAALFGGGETLGVKFGITLGRTPGIEDLNFATGSGSRGLNDAGVGELSWTQEKPLGVKLQARLGTSWVARDYATQSWGLLRLLSEATRTTLDGARVKYGWKFTHEGKTAQAVAELEFRSGSVFELELFSKLALPEKVGP
ncbi:MAG: type VI secretion system membrane subunit TssM [Planctomycetes bacterium]|nr:type VI secretion system membrane subunit TssM [Planctomycetota bacterium]